MNPIVTGRYYSTDEGATWTEDMDPDAPGLHLSPSGLRVVGPYTVRSGETVLTEHAAKAEEPPPGSRLMAEQYLRGVVQSGYESPERRMEAAIALLRWV